MTPQQFYDACAQFDWFYEMSDDNRVYRRGVEAQDLLLTHAPAGSRNREIWDGFVAHYYSGPSFNKPQLPLPVRPV